MYSTGKFAKLINKSVRTLQRWDRDNIFKPALRKPKGHRVYSHQQYIDYMNDHFSLQIK